MSDFWHQSKGSLFLPTLIGLNSKYFMRNFVHACTNGLLNTSMLNKFIQIYSEFKKCRQCLFKVRSNVHNVLSFVTVAVSAHLLQDTVNKNLKLNLGKKVSMRRKFHLMREFFNWTWECSACKFRWTSQPVYTKHSSAPTRQIIKCLGEDIPCPIDTFEKEENNECEACSDRCTKEKEMFNFPNIHFIWK